MCFSATASFGTAAVTAGCGAFALGQTTKLRELPLAAVPLLFGIQQCTEGLLWLTLERQLPPAGTAILANSFVAIALSLWPPLIPVSVALIERQRMRRMLIWCIAIAGAALGAFDAGLILHHAFGVSIRNLGLCYVSPEPYPIVAAAAYVLCVCAPLFISSEPALKPFGLLVAAGMIATAALYVFDFVSVWCFFAAAASVTVCLFFRRRREDTGRALQPAM